MIKRVIRKTAKSQDGGGEGKSAPTTEHAGEKKRKQVAIEPPPRARYSSSESENELPARQHGAPVESAHEISFV